MICIFGKLSRQNHCIWVKHPLKDFKCINISWETHQKTAKWWSHHPSPTLLSLTSRFSHWTQWNILWVQKFCCGLKAEPVVILRNCVMPTVGKAFQLSLTFLSCFNLRTIQVLKLHHVSGLERLVGGIPLIPLLISVFWVEVGHGVRNKPLFVTQHRDDEGWRAQHHRPKRSSEKQ